MRLHNLLVPLALTLLVGCEEKSTAVVLKVNNSAAVDCVIVTLESGETKVKETEIDLRNAPHKEKDWLRPYDADGLSKKLTLPVLVYPSSAFKGGQFVASAYGRLGGCEATNPITSKAVQVGPVAFVKDQIVEVELRLEPSCDNGANCDPDKDGYGPVDDCDVGRREVNPHAPENCGDAVDNNCNKKSDCDDAACDGQTCGASRKCVAGACVCVGGSFETACDDQQDNDCDGQPDCLDSNCDGKSCGVGNGLTCSNNQCLCTGGGLVQTPETSCGDNRDNDCDGLVDCADGNCAGQSCNAFGKFCSGSTCTCTVSGGPVEAAETSCGDGKDNDCDGVTDCADPDCNDKGCGANGLVCKHATTSCVCGGGGGTPEPGGETSCADGKDNDCDGSPDCTDSSCAKKYCDPAGKKSKICCGSGATAVCSDLSTDQLNCGGCGLVCVLSCDPVVVGGETISGRCVCAADAACPNPQNCYAFSGSGGGGRCGCNNNNSWCASGQECIRDTANPDYCKYPSP